MYRIQVLLILVQHKSCQSPWKSYDFQGFWCSIRAAKALGNHRIACEEVQPAFAAGVAGLLDTLLGSRIPGAGAVRSAGRAITVGAAGETVAGVRKAASITLAGPEGNSTRLVF